MYLAAIDTITRTEVNVALVFLAAIIALLGYIGRQQIKWMGRIETKVNKHDTDLEVLKAVFKATTGSHND